MKRSLFPAVLGLLFPVVLFVPSHGQEVRRPSTADLITELDDSSFHVRERASARLFEQGAAVAPDLARATWSESVEVSCRVAYLLRSMKLGENVPTSEELAKDFVVTASNSRYWAGQNPILECPDTSLDCGVSIKSPHFLLGYQSPLFVFEGKGDDGSFVREQVWAKNSHRVCGNSCDAVVYLNRPGPMATSVAVKAILVLEVAPVETLVIGEFEPKEKSIVFRKDHTWAERVTLQPEKAALTLSFRLFDLSGRIGRDMTIEAVDAEGNDVPATFEIRAPTAFSGDVKVVPKNGARPHEVRLRLAPAPVRTLKVPAQFDVRVPVEK